MLVPIQGSFGTVLEVEFKISGEGPSLFAPQVLDVNDRFALKVILMSKVDTAEPELLAMYGQSVAPGHICPMICCFYAVPDLPELKKLEGVSEPGEGR